MSKAQVGFAADKAMNSMLGVLPSASMERCSDLFFVARKSNWNLFYLQDLLSYSLPRSTIFQV